MSPLGGYNVTLPTGRPVTARRVTEVIRAGMPNPNLDRWKLENLAEWCYHNQVSADPRRTVADWNSDGRGPANRGTRLHRWMAAVILDGWEELPHTERSDEPYMQAMLGWVTNHLDPHDVQEVELPRTTEGGAVAGTPDAVIGGIVRDWKTCETHRDDHPFPEAVAQVGAYSLLPYPLELPGYPRMAEVSGAEVVYFAKDGTYRVHTLTLEEAQQLWRSVLVVAHHVLRSSPGTPRRRNERKVRPKNGQTVQAN